MSMPVRAHAGHAGAEDSGQRRRRTTSVATADTTGKCMDKKWLSMLCLTASLKTQVFR